MSVSWDTRGRRRRPVQTLYSCFKLGTKSVKKRELLCCRPNGRSRIHTSFADYFDRVYEEARQRYERKRLTGCEDELRDVTGAEAEMETRLSLAMLKNLPQAVRQPVVEGSMSSSVRCLLLFESLHERYAPGGREELESTQRYLRQLPAASDFKAAMTTMRRWKLARGRAQSLGLPEQAPNESIAALDSLMKILEKRNTQLAMKLNLLRTKVPRVAKRGPRVAVRMPKPRRMTTRTRVVLHCHTTALHVEDKLHKTPHSTVYKSLQ